MSEKATTKIETFRECLIRKRLALKVKEPKESWSKRNRGEGVAAWDGKNRQKRTARTAHAIDRLAQIRAFRRGALPDGMGASERHVPKLKRVPASVFE